MNRSLKYVLFAEDRAFVARCLDIDVASEGDTKDEAISNLQEALELYFEGQATSLSELPALDYQFGDIVVRA